MGYRIYYTTQKQTLNKCGALYITPEAERSWRGGRSLDLRIKLTALEI